MNYPSLEEVEAADREQICRWHRFLMSAQTGQEQEVLDRIVARFNELGGFTPELSKRIGWGTQD